MKISVARLMRINRNLSKYHSAVEIITLLKDLQAHYNSDSFEFKKEDACSKTAKLVEELIEFIKLNKLNLADLSTNQSSIVKEIFQTQS